MVALSIRACHGFIVLTRALCLVQNDAEAVASTLKQSGLSATPYHAGMSAKARSRAQARFMAGRVRIVVATVAFGMGIDKPDIGSVIHYHMPKSLEDYIQQIGRGGRDGSEAYCHLFLDETDARRIHSLAHVDGVVTSQAMHVLRFALRSPVPYATDDYLTATSTPVGTEGQEVSVDLARAAATTDCRQETTETILCYLEQLGLVDVLQGRYGVVDITFSKRKPGVVASHDPLIAAAVKLCGIRRDIREDAKPARFMQDFYSVEVVGPMVVRMDNSRPVLRVVMEELVEYCRVMGLVTSTAQVQRHLFQLQSCGEVSLSWYAWSMACRLTNPPTTASGIQSMASHILNRADALELRGRRKIEVLYDQLQYASVGSWRRVPAFVAGHAPEEAAAVTASRESKGLRAVRKEHDDDGDDNELSGSGGWEAEAEEALLLRERRFIRAVEQYFAGNEVGRMASEGKDGGLETGRGGVGQVATGETAPLVPLYESVGGVLAREVHAQAGRLYTDMVRSLEGQLLPTRIAQIVVNGRSVSKIFHAVHSPMFPVWTWASHGMWGAYAHVDFRDVVRLVEDMLERRRANAAAV